MTLMALAGYHEQKDEAAKKCSARHMTFPLPNETADSVFNKTLQVLAVQGIPAFDALSGESNPNKKSSSFQIVIACVAFTKSEEVELLWAETCKTLSEAINVEPLSQSRHAIYLIRVLQLSGRVVSMPKSAWQKSLSEMLQRLPIDIKIAKEKFINSDIVEISDICLRCCNIIFDVLVSSFRQLLSTKEFSTHWLMFMSVLSGNIKASSRGLPIFDETLEMMGALLRLLRPLPVAVDVVQPSSAEVGTAVLPTASPIAAAENLDHYLHNLPETVSFENFEEDSLLRESWRQILLVNAHIPHLIEKKHPKLVSDLAIINKGKLASPVSTNAKATASFAASESTDDTAITRKPSGVFSVFGF